MIKQAAFLGKVRGKLLALSHLSVRLGSSGTEVIAEGRKTDEFGQSFQFLMFYA